MMAVFNTVNVRFRGIQKYSQLPLSEVIFFAKRFYITFHFHNACPILHREKKFLLPQKLNANIRLFQQANSCKREESPLFREQYHLKAGFPRRGP